MFVYGFALGSSKTGIIFDLLSRRHVCISIKATLQHYPPNLHFQWYLRQADWSYVLLQLLSMGLAYC